MKVMFVGIAMVVAGYYLNEIAGKNRFKKYKTETANDAQSIFSLFAGIGAWLLMGFGAIVVILGISTLVCK